MTTPRPTSGSGWNGDPSPDQIRAQKRRVVKVRPLEPLANDRRYVQPAASRAAVTYDLFSWAAKHNRTSRSDSSRNPIKLHSSSFGPDGLQAPTHHARNTERFKAYFEFGSGGRVKPSGGNWELNVHRNRAVFLLCLSALVLYSLYWLVR